MAAVVLGVLAMAGVWWVTTPETCWARIVRTDLIRIGFAVEPPYAFPLIEGEAGGEFPESAKAIVQRMGGFQIEWRLADFGLLLNLLESGEIDVIAAGMFVTPERERTAAFAPPIVAVPGGLLVRAGNPLGFRSYQSIVDAEEATVAVLAGAVEGCHLRDLGMPESRLLVVSDARSGLIAVATGKTDALALSKPTVTWLAEHDWDHRTEVVDDCAVLPADVEGAVGRAAFAFRRDDLRLLSEWCRAQDEFASTPDAVALARRYGFVAINPKER